MANKKKSKIKSITLKSQEVFVVTEYSDEVITGQGNFLEGLTVDKFYAPKDFWAVSYQKRVAVPVPSSNYYETEETKEEIQVVSELFSASDVYMTLADATKRLEYLKSKTVLWYQSQIEEYTEKLEKLNKRNK